MTWTQTAIDGTTTTWTENGRDDWSVYLNDSAARRLDLQTNNATVSGTDGVSSARCTIVKVMASAAAAK